jgi:hypothetical protein
MGLQLQPKTRIPYGLTCSLNEKLSLYAQRKLAHQIYCNIPAAYLRKFAGWFATLNEPKVRIELVLQEFKVRTLIFVPGKMVTDRT